MLNRPLLARVRDRIAEVGDAHCNMDEWAAGTVKASGTMPCGTAACIAGWTLAVHHGHWSDSNVMDDPSPEAEALLGLPNDRLFFTGNWPKEYQKICDAEGDAKGMLAICDALLDGRVSPADFDLNDFA